MKTSDLPQIYHPLRISIASICYNDTIDATTRETAKVIKIWDFVYQQVDWVVSDHLWRLSK